MTAMTYTLSLDIPRSTTTAANDTKSNRYFRREWKKGAAIPKYDSLPVLRLAPTDRPLFRCDKCCSANLYVPVCLWCKWTSETALEQFQQEYPRSRTVSAPRFSSDLLGPKKSAKRRRVGMVVTTTLQSREPVRPVDIRQSTTSTQAQTTYTKRVERRMEDDKRASSISSCNFNRPLTAITEDRHSPTPASSIHKAKATSSTTSLASFDDQFIPQERKVSRARVNGGSSSTDRSSAQSAPVTPSPKHVRHANRPMSTPGSYSNSRPSCPTSRRQPLYNYIRTNTHSLSSPFHSGIDYRLDESRNVQGERPIMITSLPIGSSRRLCTSQSQATNYDLAISTPHALTYPNRGFSISGETELRMDLARRKVDGPSSDFRFVDRKEGRRKQLTRKLKNFSKSFKGLFQSIGN